MKKLIIILIMVIVSSIFLVSCAPPKTGRATATPIPTISATITPTATPKPSATSSPSPSPTPCKKETEKIDCYDGNDCTEDICNKKKKCENPNKPDGTRCDPSPSPTPSASASGTPGSSPSATPEEYYFCENGVCKKKKECKDELGEDYITCPTGVEKGKEGYAMCCKITDRCCHEDTDADPICCNKNPTLGSTAQCDTLGFLGEKLGKVHGNVCDYDECVAPKSLPCTKGGGLYKEYTICCNPTTEICTHQDVDVPILPDSEIPACVPKSGCKDDQWKCKDLDGGPLCCRGTEENKIEECFSRNNVYWCSAIEGKCPEGETFCKGEKQAAGTPDKEGNVKPKNNCCPVGTTCFHEPNGLPKCVGTTTSTAEAGSLVETIIIS